MSTRGEPMGRTVLLSLVVALAALALIGVIIGLAWLIMGA